MKTGETSHERWLHWIVPLDRWQIDNAYLCIVIHDGLSRFVCHAPSYSWDILARVRYTSQDLETVPHNDLIP